MAIERRDLLLVILNEAYNRGYIEVPEIRFRSIIFYLKNIDNVEQFKDYHFVNWLQGPRSRELQEDLRHLTFLDFVKEKGRGRSEEFPGAYEFLVWKIKKCGRCYIAKILHQIDENLMKKIKERIRYVMRASEDELKSTFERVFLEKEMYKSR